MNKHCNSKVKSADICTPSTLVKFILPENSRKAHFVASAKITKSIERSEVGMYNFVNYMQVKLLSRL